MSTIKVNSIKNTSTNDGGIAIDNSGHVQIDGVQLPTVGALSNRNLIINGAMNVWQRGTSQTTSGGYGADRFWMANATSAARNTSAPAGFTYSTKLTYSSSDMSIGQPIELTATGEQDGALASGNTVTLSYYAKVDSETEAIGTVINFRDSKFSSSNQVAFTSSNSSATWTTTWTRYEHQFTVPTVAGTNVLAGLEINGISKDAYITGVQLEVGEKATPFEHRSYGDELARCQRYYETTYRSGYSEGHNFNQEYPFVDSRPVGINFIASDDGTTAVSFSYRVTKRTDPTVRLFSAKTGASNKAHTYRSGAGNNTDVTIAAIWTTPNYCTIATSLNAVNRANESYLHIVGDCEL